MKSQIIKACDELKNALIAEYEASQLEVESKVKKIASHKQVQIARDALSDIKFY